MSKQMDLFNSNESLSLLSKITAIQPENNLRDSQLLRDPINSLEVNEWAFLVPQCFNDALDIKKTIRSWNKKKLQIWTQGSTFYFKTGDIFYNKKKAYTDWSNAISDELCAIQVVSGKSSVPGIRDKKDKKGKIIKIGKDRDKGEVSFAVYQGNKKENVLIKKELHITTQDDFIKILICGYK
jgi:hypothetical protein